MARKAKRVKNIEVTEVFDNSVKVNIKHSPKMAEAVDALVDLEEGNFHEIVAVAKKCHRLSSFTSELFDSSKVTLTVVGTEKSFEIINLLTSLGKDEFRKAVKCAKRYRRVNKLLSLANNNYKELKDEDNKSLSQKKGIAYA
ncbi:hypothetical protein IKF23_01915 [Candidatus Saccharibacteria bacterium]|nr:hypothetical protein [Candidatus Saccharibacteria bacterium]